MDIENKKDQAKIEGFFSYIGEITNIQKKMNGSMGEKIFFYKSSGSHPEEKLGLEAMDPTPKRNLVWK